MPKGGVVVGESIFNGNPDCYVCHPSPSAQACRLGIVQNPVPIRERAPKRGKNLYPALPCILDAPRCRSWPLRTDRGQGAERGLAFLPGTPALNRRGAGMPAGVRLPTTSSLEGGHSRRQSPRRRRGPASLPSELHHLWLQTKTSDAQYRVPRGLFQTGKVCVFTRKKLKYID